MLFIKSNTLFITEGSVGSRGYLPLSKKMLNHYEPLIGLPFGAASGRRQFLVEREFVKQKKLVAHKKIPKMENKNLIAELS